jgi:hypothetical protein
MNDSYGYNKILPLNSLNYYTGVSGTFWDNYHMWTTGLILDKELSIDKLNMYNRRKNIKPWNKGKKLSKAHCDKLSKAAKNRVCTDEGKLARRIAMRKSLPKVKVFYKKDDNLIFIKEWNSAKDLEEASMADIFELTKFMTLKNKIGRNGYHPHVLKTFNINKSNKNNTPYKGLYFKLI